MVGTDRVTPDTSIYGLVATVAGDGERTAEEVLLDGAAILRQFRDVNPPIDKYSGDKPAPTPPDELQICSPKLKIHLSRVLESGNTTALPEIMAYLETKKWAFPPELLPKLFDLCLKDDVLFRSVKPFFDNRAYWLIAQNPDWYGLDDNLALLHWKELFNSQKKMALSAVVQENTGKALSFIENYWDKAGAKDREIFLQAIQVHPSELFIPILHKSTTGSQKSIRKTAAKILASIPESEHYQFLASYARKLLIKGEWHIPDSYLKDTAHLNLPLEMKKGVHLSMKGAWLGNTIGYLAPTIWEEITGYTPASAIPMLLDSPYRSEVFAGLTTAIVRHRDEHWREALIRYLWENRAYSFAKMPSKTLLSNLSMELFDRVALQMTRESTQMPENGLLHLLIKHNDTKWSAALSRLLFSRFKKDLERDTSNPAMMSGYKLMLEKAIHLVDRGVTEDIISEWPEQCASWIYWEARVYRFKEGVVARVF